MKSNCMIELGLFSSGHLLPDFGRLKVHRDDYSVVESLWEVCMVLFLLDIALMIVHHLLQ